MLTTSLVALLLSSSLSASAANLSGVPVTPADGERQWTSMGGMYYVQEQLTGYQAGVSDPAQRTKLEADAEETFRALNQSSFRYLFVYMGVDDASTKAAVEARYATMLDRLRRLTLNRKQIIVQLMVGGLWNWEVYSYANVVQSQAVRKDFLEKGIYPYVDALNGVAAGVTIWEETGASIGSDAQMRIPLELSACLDGGSGTMQKACHPDLFAECGDISKYDFAATLALQNCLKKPNNGGPGSCLRKMRGRNGLSSMNALRRPPEQESLDCLQNCVREIKGAVGLTQACETARLRNGLAYVDHVGAAPIWYGDAELVWRNDGLRMCNLKRWGREMDSYVSSIRSAASAITKAEAEADWIQGRVIMAFEKEMAEAVATRSRGGLPYYLWSNCFSSNCLPALAKAGGIISSIYGYPGMFRYGSYLNLLMRKLDPLSNKNLLMFAGAARKEDGEGPVYVAEEGQRASFVALGLALNAHGLGFFDLPLKIIDRNKAEPGKKSRFAEDDDLFKTVYLQSTGGTRFPSKVLVVTDDLADWNADFFSVNSFKYYDVAPMHALRTLFPDDASLRQYKMIVLFSPGTAARPNCSKVSLPSESRLCGYDDAQLDRYVQGGGLLALVGPMNMDPGNSAFLGGRIVADAPVTQAASAKATISPAGLAANLAWQRAMGMPARSYSTLIRPGDFKAAPGTPAADILFVNDAEGRTHKLAGHVARGTGGVLVVPAWRPQRGGSECLNKDVPECGGVISVEDVARQYAVWQNFMRDLLFAFARAHKVPGTMDADNWFSTTFISERSDPSLPPLIRYHKNASVTQWMYPVDSAPLLREGRFMLREFVVYPDSVCNNLVKSGHCPVTWSREYGFEPLSSALDIDLPWNYLTRGRIRRFEPQMGGANLSRSFYYRGADEAKFGGNFQTWLSHRVN